MLFSQSSLFGTRIFIIDKVMLKCTRVQPSNKIHIGRGFTLNPKDQWSSPVISKTIIKFILKCFNWVEINNMMLREPGGLRPEEPGCLCMGEIRGVYAVMHNKPSCIPQAKYSLSLSTSG